MLLSIQSPEFTELPESSSTNSVTEFPLVEILILVVSVSMLVHEELPGLNKQTNSAEQLVDEAPVIAWLLLVTALAPAKEEHLLSDQ